MAVVQSSCRACAQHLNPSDAQNAKGFFETKKETYTNLTTLQVQNNDDLPELFCNKCYLLLCQFGTFKQTCIQSVELLKNRIVFKVEVDSNASWEDQENYQSDGEDSDESENIKRPKKKKTPTKRDTKKTVKTEPNAVEDPEEEPKPKSNKPKTRPPKMKPCAMCSEEFVNYRNLKRHVQEVHAKDEAPNFKCDECYKMFYTQYALKTHQKCHTGQQFICDQCGRSFATKIGINTHMDSHTTGHQVPCPLCDRTFESRSQMYSHKYKKHSKSFNAPATCLICNTTFGNLKKMQNHRSLVHTVYTCDSERVLQCPYCIMKLKTNAILRKHIQLVHSGERNYPCPECEKRFKTTAALKKHSYFHSGERPVSCEICNKGFYQKGALNIHMNVHKKQWIAEGVQGIELYKYRNNVKQEKGNDMDSQ